MIATIMSAAALIAVVISWSMPTVQDYHKDLDSINYRLSQIADNLARIAERMGKADDH